MSKLDINNDARPQLPNNQTYVPLRVNDKQSVIGMESDTVGILLVGIAIGHISKNLLLIGGIAILLALAYSWVKDNYPKGRLKHMLWWAGIINFKSRKSFPEAFNRTYFR
ncbi:conjugal transfer pilus assembly protein TraL [Vibrio crassostreae]|nr:conjugal transfer pilus assembly protein TraL [Vibrio crassostreae]CAK2769381.1 conjugal transfer pilus assembly protein TraL [Vibrio crassostreae]CAK3222723.1 conjugal transfer pilus assembly protein TraL [Vibrio crassostreae]CAK3838655.1 conjugal transfer pilus assembly protein TraL [Vibrio crassostreae]